MALPSPALDRLLRPRSIATIGGAAAARVIEQCDRLGFDGTIWPIHPSRETVAGRRAYRTVEQLPGSPDAAFVGVNRRATVSAVDALAKRRAGGAVCYAAGFLEADGGELQDELVVAADAMPIVGPNCYGLLNYLDGVALWPDQHGGRRLGPDGRGVAVVTQSSNMAISITMQRRGLPIAFVATAGNQAQLGISALAAALLDDQRVSALGLHIEGFDSLAGYEALSAKARRRRLPVVVLKTGNSPLGQAATLSHTASIAGGEAGANALLRRLGFARAGTMAELLETLKLLHVHGPLQGRRIGALCCSGGEASVVADAFALNSLTLPPLAPEHAAAVAETTHPLVHVANPFDYHTFSWGNEEALRTTFAAFAAGGLDACVLALDFPRDDRCDDADWLVTERAFQRALAGTGTSAVVMATLAENMPEHHAERLVAHGVAPLGGVSETVAALAGAAAVGDAWRRPQPPPALASDVAAGEPVLWNEAAAKAELAAFGVAIPPGGIARSAAEAAAAAASLGGATVVKTLGLAHKTERDAVRLDLHTATEVEAAARELLALGDGLLVEAQVRDIVAELIVGVHRDPALGLLLSIGAGGVLAELADDSATLMLPTNAEEVRDGLSTLRCATLIEGYRRRPAGDLKATIDAILAIGRFAAAHRTALEELDVNPLAVLPQGRGAVALDALVRIRASS